jgi:gliding motility-associated-like protein
MITDAAGCIYDTLVTIQPTNPYTVDAGPDIEIYLGEKATLAGFTDIEISEIFSQEWDSTGNILCQDCLETIVSPHTTTTYSFTVRSRTGCIISDDLTVFVLEKGKFFIPDIFTPNGDGFNDEIRLFASAGILKINKWVIFDRWGNAVFGNTDFDPFDPGVYWDGTTSGSEKLNPGVFPYIIELELINGNREIHHGTITLVR